MLDCEDALEDHQPVIDSLPPGTRRAELSGGAEFLSQLTSADPNCIMTFTVVYSHVVLASTLDKNLFTIWKLLVSAVEIFSRSHILPAALDQAEHACIEFYRQYSALALRHKCVVSPAMHALLHVAESIRRFGPRICSWRFE